RDCGVRLVRRSRGRDAAPVPRRAADALSGWARAGAALLRGEPADGGAAAEGECAESGGEGSAGSAGRSTGEVAPRPHRWVATGVPPSVRVWCWRGDYSQVRCPSDTTLTPSGRVKLV